MESLHPMTVHFPIALLLAALLIEALALIFKHPDLHRTSLWVLGLGAMGAIAAVVTGRMAEGVAKHSLEIHQVMHLHERLGYVVLGLAIVVTGWRLLKKDRLTLRTRRIAWALLVVACGIMAFSAHLGGRLVYEFGVGGSYGRSSGIQVVPHLH